MFVDQAAALMSDFVTGANREDYHYTGANWERDLPLPEVVDLRMAVAGDPSPDGGGELQVTRGIEVGQIFKLGTKYSDAMQATVLDADGQQAHHVDGLLWHRCDARRSCRH
jgi:prolyl-tRNA synthetase